MDNKTAIQQRLLALSVLVLLILVLVFLIAKPLWHNTVQLHDKRLQLAFRLQRYEQLLSRKAALTERLQQLKQQDSVQSYFLPPTDATTVMETQLKTLITHAGGQLKGIEPLDDIKPAANFSSLSFSLDFSATTEVLHNVLQQLELAMPLIFIDKLSIKNVSDDSEQLNISLQVSSFMRKVNDEQR